MIDDAYKLPASLASLPVLPSGGAVEHSVIAALSDELQMPRVEETLVPLPGPVSPAFRILEGKIIAAISKVYDPEIPVNVYELGLIYGIDIKSDLSVTVRMTLTAPGCPVAGSLPLEVEKQVESVDEVKEAEVVLVWDPPWDKSRMSEAAMLHLNLA